MVHPTTGKTISSYKHLMHNLATAKTWQTAFGKDFGSMAQGNNKTGQKGTNSIFVMTHKEIAKNPNDQTITYAHVVVNFHPQKTQICTEIVSLPGAISSITPVNFQHALRTLGRQN
jgi:hypothetical protein